LQKEHAKVLKQKKQFQLVVVLALAIFGCGVGLFFLNDTLKMTKGQLDEANNVIIEKDNDIKYKNKRITNLNNSIDSLQYEYNEEHNKKVKIEERLTNICNSNPFVITNCSVSSSDFNFDYYSDQEKDVTVTLKAINEKSLEIVSNTHTFTVYKGSMSKKLNFNYRLDSSDYYYVILIYDGRIIAGKRW